MTNNLFHMDKILKELEKKFKKDVPLKNLYNFEREKGMQFFINYQHVEASTPAIIFMQFIKDLRVRHIKEINLAVIFNKEETFRTFKGITGYLGRTPTIKEIKNNIKVDIVFQEHCKHVFSVGETDNENVVIISYASICKPIIKIKNT